MNRIITIAFATLVPAVASAAPAAPRVDAQTVEADRAYVQTVGLLRLLNAESSAAATVLGSAQIGPALDRAIAQLTGARFASLAPDPFRRAPQSSGSGSVVIGAVRAPDASSFELAEHRGHFARAPSTR